MTAGTLIISVGGHRFGVALDAVDSIADRGGVTLLPHLPAGMPGVVDVRGRAVPLIDVGVIAGEAPRLDRSTMVIATDGTRSMALLVDFVERIEESAEDSDSSIPLLDVSSIMERVS